ncbi:hypothetical protein HK096_010732, partial [Nowakowskiella sp. JEL0078]
MDPNWIVIHPNDIVEFCAPLLNADSCVLSEYPLVRLDSSPDGLPKKLSKALDYKTTVYYEVTILELSFNPQTVVSVGLATKPYPPFRMVGWNKYSIGIHSDDGRLFENDKFGGRSFTGPFSKSQTIGCGYDEISGRVFFTIDGAFIAEATKKPSRHPYHACIAADGKAVLSFNFGKQPFMF